MILLCHSAIESFFFWHYYEEYFFVRTIFIFDTNDSYLFIAAVAENSVKKYLDNAVTENTVAENAVAENGLIFSRIKKTAEDCLRNYLQKKHTQPNYLESGIDITSMKKQLPIIYTN